MWSRYDFAYPQGTCYKTHVASTLLQSSPPRHRQVSTTLDIKASLACLWAHHMLDAVEGGRFIDA